MQKATKPLLIVIGILQVVLWGVAPLLTSPWMADLHGITYPGEFVHFARYMGLCNLIWGLMLISIAFNPLKHSVVVTFSILFYIATIVLTALMMFWLGELSTGEWLWWLVMALCAVYAILLIIFYPREEKTAPTF